MHLNGDSNVKIPKISSTTTGTTGYSTGSLDSFSDPKDMKQILTYALPLACAAIMVVLLIVVVLYRRHRVLENWTSLTRMKNTNPKFYERTGLRRDSEYEDHSESSVSVATINDDTPIQSERSCRLATIT